MFSVLGHYNVDFVRALSRMVLKSRGYYIYGTFSKAGGGIQRKQTCFFFRNICSCGKQMLLVCDTRDVGISNIRPRVSAHEIKMMCVQQVYPNKPLTIIVVANG